MRGSRLKRNILILFVLLSVTLTLFQVRRLALHVCEIIRLDKDPGSNPVISPDGEQIAFVRKGELVGMNLSTHDQTKHEIEDILSDIQWLTNSRLLYLKSELPDVHDELRFWIVDIQSRKTIPLTEILPEHPENVTLSPSKSTIAYSTQTRIPLFDIKTNSFSFYLYLFLILAGATLWHGSEMKKSYILAHINFGKQISVLVNPDCFLT